MGSVLDMMICCPNRVETDPDKVELYSRQWRDSRSPIT